MTIMVFMYSVMLNTFFLEKRIEQKFANNYKAAIRNRNMKKELMIIV